MKRPRSHPLTILAQEGDMAEILDLCRAIGTSGSRSNEKSTAKPGAAADIIIFPGVRYDRIEEVRREVVAPKKRAGRKTTGPATPA